MEDAVREQHPAVVLPGKSKLRYPLRSAAKSKEGKEKPPPATELSSSSVSKRGRAASSVSKSESVLDLSGKEKSTSARLPRRLSVPAKSLVSPIPKPSGTGNVTPISRARTKRSTSNVQGKNETPLSEVSRTSGRKKFCALSSASYWLSQIKLSESAAKHSVSLGFFRLALEAGCEPLQRMRDELKSYVHRHELSEVEEHVKDLFQSYNISDNQEQVQVSATCSQMPEEGTRSSDDEVRSSSTMGNRKLRPRSLNADTVHTSSNTESAKKETTQKNSLASRTRGSLNKNTVNIKSASDTGSRKIQKKPERPSKQEASGAKTKLQKKQGRKSAVEEGSISPSAAEVTPEENKENMDAQPVEEISPTEVA